MLPKLYLVNFTFLTNICTQIIWKHCCRTEKEVVNCCLDKITKSRYGFFKTENLKILAVFVMFWSFWLYSNRIILFGKRLWTQMCLLTSQMIPFLQFFVKLPSTPGFSWKIFCKLQLLSNISWNHCTFQVPTPTRMIFCKYLQKFSR